MKRTLGSLLLAFSLGFAPTVALACDGEDKVPTTADSKPAPAGAQTVAYNVDGMHCAGCANKVEAAIRKLPGIYTVKVDLQTNTATVAFDQKKVNIDQIKKAIAKAGYRPGSVA